jgi:leucyl aminopeptidase (aminopeptidase T)
MRDLLMMRGARTLLDVCVAVTPAETVLIVTDMQKASIARVIAAAAMERGAEAILAIMPPRQRAGQEPPKPVAEAMRSADIVLLPVSYSVTHTHAVKNAAAAGARIVALTEFTEDMMISGGLEADFTALKPVCQRVAARFAAGARARITTPAGTDLQMDITGRPGNALYCIVERGQFSPVPNVEANVSPIEGTASGRIVVDASIPYLGIGLIETPVVVEVRDGFITSIQGGRQADTLRRDLESHGDPNSYNIAELGVGLNPKCRMIGVMLEDEGVQGSAHIGIGTNITLGGKVKASCHYDLLVWKPRIEVDGEVIVDDADVRV